MLYKKSLGIASLITFLLALSLFSCPSAPSAKQGTAETQAQHDPSLPLWTGDGGKGLSLAVLEPTGRGISQNEQWMLSLIQSSLTGDFNKYSAMAIIDRQNLEKIIAEQMQSMSGFYSDDDYIRIGNLANAKFILGGSVSRTANAFMLELAVTDVESGVRKASLSPTPVTPAALENLSAVKEASAELLRQMGVALTASGLAELKRPLALSQVNAETALARGVVAQRQGTEVAALSYYFQAASFDSSLIEAVNRSSTMSANISSGNIGMDIRNDIVWRREWVARLTETENFINNIPPPYTFFYSTGIETGAINYQTETAHLSIEANMRGSGLVPLQKALQAVYDGLNATKRKNEWGLANWPQQAVTNTNLFSQKQNNIQVVFELANNQNRVIGSQAVTMGPVFRFTFNNNRIGVDYTENNFYTVAFNAVKADDISDSLTIRIASVNGAAPQSAQFQITALTGAQWQTTRNLVNPAYLDFDSEGVLRGFIRSLSDGEIAQCRDLVLPTSEFWGEPVPKITSIGDTAFSQKQLTSVTIPNGVTSIGVGAFFSNQLTSVTIPNSVTSIGEDAFNRNQLTSVTIPNGVTSIGRRAFEGNQLTSVRIPDSVRSIGYGAFLENQLTSVTLSKNLSAIEEYAFANNKLYRSVSIPNSVKSIGEHAFYHNELNFISWDKGSLTSSIGEYAFAYNKLRTVTIPGSVKIIGNNAFSDNELTSADIPNGVTSIGEYAFSDNQLFELIIPNSVTSIGEYAFSDNRLREVTIPNRVTSIGEGVFFGNKLTSVTIPNSVKSIGQYAFSNNKLTSITIGSNVVLHREISKVDYENSFEQEFDEAYIKGGKRAGTYTLPSVNSYWTRK